MTSSNLPDGTDRQIQSLRSLLTVLIAVLVVITASVAVYLRGQSMAASAQAARAKLEIDRYEKQLMPGINGLIGALQDYSKTHPDINPLLAKYNMTPLLGAAPQKPAAVAPPKSAAPAKK